METLLARHVLLGLLILGLLILGLLGFGLGRRLLLALLLLFLRRLLLLAAASRRRGFLARLPEPDVELVQGLALQIAGTLVRADVDERPRHPLHRRGVQPNVLCVLGVVHGFGIRKSRAAIRAFQNLLENMRQHALVQGLVRLQLEELRPGFEQRVGGVRGHGPGRGRDARFPLFTLLARENRPRRAAVRLVLLVRIASDLHVVLAGRDVSHLGDEHLREVQTQADVHDALVTLTRGDERGSHEHLADVAGDRLGPVPVRAVTEDVGGEPADEAEVLVHAVPVDADPLAPRGDEEDPGVHQRHAVLELVNQASDRLGEFLLDVPPVGVPHGVEEAFPDLLHVEHVHVGPRAEPLAERAEGCVAHVLLAVRELAGERIFTIGHILRRPRLVRLAFLLVEQDGRERRELVADARHVTLLLNVRFHPELHHGCRSLCGATTRPREMKL